MPHLQLNESQFPLFVGETHVGRGVGADIPLPGSESQPTTLIAVVTLGDDHVATISSASDSDLVLLNGIPVGRDASPMRHGDRIEIGDFELRFADELQGMITHPVAAASSGASHWNGTKEPARTGGRLVSLIDGREYLMSSGSLTIGRDAGCDVVVAVTEVSRRHARIESTSDGYVLVDTSTNGVLLNGERIKDRALLSRGDTLRVGPEEFRFHADLAPVAAPSPTAPLSQPFPMPAVGTRAPAESGTVADDLVFPSSEKPRRAILATLEVLNEGPGKGSRIELTTPLSHVGRGAHNDVIINDDSVSDLHAKIQLREDGWYVVDMGSTNGTYVAGNRVVGEVRLLGNVDVRFGGMKYAFRDMGGGHAAPHGTRVIVGLKGPAPQRMSEPEGPLAAASTTPSEPERIGIPRGLLIALVVLAVAIVYFFLSGA
ncbi:MAG: FHA domain-containing protein [Gemmatimonadaceae bacterium]